MLMYPYTQHDYVPFFTADIFLESHFIHFWYLNYIRLITVIHFYFEESISSPHADDGKSDATPGMCSGLKKTSPDCSFRSYCEQIDYPCNEVSVVLVLYVSNTSTTPAFQT